MFFFDLEPVVVLGPELVTNGGFVGNADGWIVGDGWSYTVGGMIHTPGPVDYLAQADNGLTIGSNYRLSIQTTGSTVGYIVIYFGQNPVSQIIVENGLFELDLVWPGESVLVQFIPSYDFDGSITNVSVKEIL